MAEKTPKEILDDLQAAQKEAKKAGLIDQHEKTDAVINEAESAKAQANKGAAADYNNYQKNNAGKSETSGMYAYNAYRSRLAAAAKAAQDAKEKADLSYNMTEANAKANLKNAQAAEQASRNDQHWQQKQWDYQLAVDEAERVAREEAERAAEEAERARAAAKKTSGRRSSSSVTSGRGDDPENDSGTVFGKSRTTRHEQGTPFRGLYDRNGAGGGGGGGSWGSRAKSIDELMHQAKDISFNGQWNASKKERERILAEAEALGYDKDSDEYKDLLFYLKGKAPKSTYF